MEKYSDQAWILRYRKERDAALKAHRRQYRRRQILSKFGLARAPVSDEYERFIDVDRVSCCGFVVVCAGRTWEREQGSDWDLGDVCAHTTYT